MMTWADAAQLITALSSMGAVLMAWRNGRKLEAVHVDINGRMSQLLKAATGEANLAGRAELTQEQKTEARSAP